MPNLISTLTIRLTDQLSAPAKQVASSLKVVGLSAKDLERIGRIDAFRKLQNDFAAARGTFREAQQDVQRLARELAAAERPTVQLQRAYANAQRQVASASSTFERQSAALIKAKRDLQGLGVSVNQIAGEETRLRAAVDRASAAMERQAARAQSVGSRIRGALFGGGAGKGGHGGGGALGIVGFMAAHRMAEFGRHTLETYREFDRERRFMKAVMGLSDAELAPLVKQAIHLGATTKYNDIAVLEAQRELAARGLKRDQIRGIIPEAANLGQALNLALPDAVKQLEGSIFALKKPIETHDDAVRSAKQTADVQVKAAKISGMTPEDIVQLYKYGATPARLAGMSEASLLAFGGVLKKANMGGDESGVAFRQLIASLTTPTRKAKEAMLANGLDFKNYQKTPDRLALEPFVKNVAAQYGVELGKAAQGRLEAIFRDPAVFSAPERYTVAVMDALRRSLHGNDAKSLRSIAGMANRYRDASMKGVEIDKLMIDLLKKVGGNIALANAIFGPKQGGRIATVLSDPAALDAFVAMITGHSEGYAQRIASERMAGFDGAVSRLEGSLMNLKTAIGRSWDDGGKGGPLTSITDMAAKLTQSLSEMDAKVLQVASGLAGLGGLYVLGKSIGLIAGGFGLKSSAAALDVAAANLDAAALKLGATGSVPGKVAKGAAAGAAVPGALTAAGLRRGGPVAAAITGLEVMKEDAKNGNHVRSWLRSLFGLPDAHEPAPWMPGGAWDRDRAHRVTGLTPEQAGAPRITLDAIRRRLAGAPRPAAPRSAAELANALPRPESGGAHITLDAIKRRLAGEGIKPQLAAGLTPEQASKATTVAPVAPVASAAAPRPAFTINPPPRVPAVGWTAGPTDLYHPRRPGDINRAAASPPYANVDMSSVDRLAGSLSDQSAAAGSAGHAMGQSFREALLDELRKAEGDVGTVMRRIIDHLTFSASPDVRAPAAAPQGGASPGVSNSGGMQRGLFADYGIAGP